MSGCCSRGVLIAAIMIAGILVAGCISQPVGDVTYRDGNISIDITSPAAGTGSYIQVTVFEIRNFSQNEIAVFGTQADLVPGKNTISVPGQIEPGSYKLYIHVIQNGIRQTAVIRDIRV